MNRTIPSPIRPRATALLASGLLLLAACSSNGGDDADPPTTTEAPTATAAPADAGGGATATEDPADAGTDGELGEAVPMTFGDDLFVADLDDPAAFPANASAELEVGGGSVVIAMPASDTAFVGATGGSSFYDEALHVTALADTVDVESPVNGTWGVHCRGEGGEGYIGAITQATSDPNQYNWTITRVGDGTAEVLAGGGDDAWITNTGGSVRIGLSCNSTSRGEVLDLLVGEDWVGQAVDRDPIDGAFTGIYGQTSSKSGGALRFSDLRIIELVAA
jgi:hypothetical protein